MAFAALRRIDHEGAYANLVVPHLLSASRLDERDRAFATGLVYGTVRMRGACDALVDRFIVSEPDAAIRSLLRLGAFQLVFGGVAQHAAVGETVALAPKRARGFVNAILRNVARTPMIWSSDASRLSYPQWMTDRLTVELGDECWPALERMNQPAPVTERVDGYVQDLASQWVAAAVEVEPSHVVLDVCSAPGGKSTAMAAAGGFVIAADRSLSRSRLVRDNIAACRSSATAIVVDGARPCWAEAAFNRVLIDAPCSGLGALRRRPDARWRITPTDIDELAVVQRDLLAASAGLVRPGGALVYSVCTLTAAESIDHPIPVGFEVDRRPMPDGEWRPFGHGWRVLPHDADTDGMVIIRYRRLDD